jgi:carotenoid cleavage dioxygenase-like enzyme
MATPFPADNPYLSGGFEPIRFECDYDDLIVEGEIPVGLSGCLYRIGPNPQFAPLGPYNPLGGDGMIHAFNIRGGRVSYRNRWVRTQQWQQERASGRALFGTLASGGVQTDGVANTNLVRHAGRLLALEEGHAPIEIDPVTLDTIGAWDFAASNVTAHPKIDPDSGEAVWFACFPKHDFTGVIDLCVVDRAGRLVRRERVAGPYPGLIHDCALTRDFVVFFLSPLVVSIERARAGGPAVAWEPERGSWLGIVPRSGGGATRWISMPASMVWHAMNAFNDDQVIYVDVCQQAAAAFPSASGVAPSQEQLQQFLTRWRIDWPGGRQVVCERLSEVICEYPRIDERRCGREYRYGFVACHGGPGTGDLFHRAIGRFDHTTGRMAVYRANDLCAVSEPVFVPRSPASPEADGYLLTVNFDECRKASYLAIFDAQTLERGPIARVLLDHRVPMGFHGTWLPR